MSRDSSGALRGSREASRLGYDDRIFVIGNIGKERDEEAQKGVKTGNGYLYATELRKSVKPAKVEQEFSVYWFRAGGAISQASCRGHSGRTSTRITCG